MDKNDKVRDIVLVPQAVAILKNYFRPDAKPDEYIFPLLDNNAPYAKHVSTTERYMGNFDTQRTDNALIGRFGSMKTPKDKKSEVLDMLKEMSPEDIAAIMHALQK